MRAYNADLASRPQIVVATKIDALNDPDRLESLRQQVATEGAPFFAISSVANKGTKELVAAIAVQLDELTEAARQAEPIELAF